MSNIIFPERESKLLEFKSKITDFGALIKTSIAFANAAGGRIVIGVDDKTREIIGITEKERIRIHDDFPNSLYDSAAPNLVPQIYEQNFGEKTVAVVYHDEGDFVKVIFYFQPHLEKKSDAEAILALMQSAKHATAGEVADYLGVSRNTAIRKLNSLVQKNQLIKVGKGPAVKYKLM
jgi:predicted HTH transcriptional regulator